MAILSKSDLASFRQCPRKLWLEHHHRDFIPQNDPTLWRRANDGNIVGAKARELYVKDNVPRAMFQWSKQKWLNRQGRPIENATLWKDLVRIIKKVPKRVDFEWVKGHSKSLHNKAVDKLAKLSAKGVLNEPLRVASVRRKKSLLTVEIGSVPMRGQTLSIRIITDTYLRVQRIYKYKYEVLTDSPELAGRVDLIFADECLRAGHHYEVRVNDDTRNPRIVEVVRELETAAPTAG